MKSKIISVIGPTASGKTDLAINIAKKFIGELVNTDSRQIYKFLNIGTAKGNIVEYEPYKYSLDKIPIHLVNIISPEKILTLAEYQKKAITTIKDVISRKKLPILVGGTGLYIDAIVKGYFIPKIAPDIKLRSKLNKLTIEELKAKLISINKAKFEKLNHSDQNNPRRIIRAIEIELNNIQTSQIQNTQSNITDQFETLFIKPKYNRKDLYKKINSRVYQMIDQGLFDEVRNLMDRGYKFDQPAFSAIAYPLARKYLNKEISKELYISTWQQKERNYARRQETWFRRYNCLKYSNIEDLFNRIDKFLTDN